MRYAVLLVGLLCGVGATCLGAGTAHAANADHAIVGECDNGQPYPEPDLPSVECPVNLTKGQDYVLRKWPELEGCVEMVNPQRNVFATICDYDNYSITYEFRAGQTGTFWIRARWYSPDYESEAAGTLYTDCKDANNTTCRLPLTGSVTGDAAGHGDFDRLKTPTLRKGRRYTFTFRSDTGARTPFTIQTATGKVLLEGSSRLNALRTLRFKAPANAPVYVRTGTAGPYTMTLR